MVKSPVFITLAGQTLNAFFLAVISTPPAEADQQFPLALQLLGPGGVSR